MNNKNQPTDAGFFLLTPYSKPVPLPCSTSIYFVIVHHLLQRKGDFVRIIFHCYSVVIGKVTQLSF